MTAKPKITLVIPNLNVGNFLEQTIESVIRQSYPNLELIMVDGGSTDNSHEIIERHRQHFAHVIIEPDKGQGDALNKGFRKSTGDVMGWINSDDVLMPGALARVGRLFELRRDTSWITGRLVNINEQGEVTLNSPARVFSRIRFLAGDYQWIQQESTFWRRELWTQAGGHIDDTQRLAVDGELWFRFFQFAKLQSINMEIGAFRIRAGQRSGVIKDYHREMTALAARYRDLAPTAYREAFPYVFSSEVMPRRRPDADKIAGVKREDLKVIDFAEIDPNLPNVIHPITGKNTSVAPARPVSQSDDLSAFRNRHAGQRCFIMGNGPSLNRMDLSRFAGETVFAANSSYLLFDRIDWRPTYYSCVDTRVLPDTAAEIDAMHRANPDMVLFFPDHLKIWDGSGNILNTREIIAPASNRYFFRQIGYNRQELPYSAFSLDSNDHLCQPNTVTITLMQLAAYMGFTDIFLIGCDTSYVVPKTVQQDGPEVKDGTAEKLLLTSTEDDDPNHFDTRYFGQGRKWHAPKVQDMIFHYQLAAQVLEEVGIRVYNATVGGNLEVFPRVDYEDALAGAVSSTGAPGTLADVEKSYPQIPGTYGEWIENIIRLASEDDLSGVTGRRLLLTVLSALIIAPVIVLRYWQRDPRLPEAVQRVLLQLPANDALRQHFFAVWSFSTEKNDHKELTLNASIG